MTLLELFRQCRVPFACEGEDKHARAGWVQTLCPWCRGTSFHLGWSLKTWATNCYRCGKHKRAEALAKLAGIPVEKAQQLLRGVAGSSQSPKSGRRAATEAEGRSEWDYRQTFTP